MRLNKVGEVLKEAINVLQEANQSQPPLLRMLHTTSDHPGYQQTDGLGRPGHWILVKMKAVRRSEEPYWRLPIAHYRHREMRHAKEGSLRRTTPTHSTNRHLWRELAFKERGLSRVRPKTLA